MNKDLVCRMAVMILSMIHLVLMVSNNMYYIW